MDMTNNENFFLDKNLISFISDSDAPPTPKLGRKIIILILLVYLDINYKIEKS